MLRLLLFSVVVCGVFAASASSHNDAAGPTTQSVSGVFRGSWMETRRGRRFEAYRGIRYAEPPVGALRFQPPQPILSYKQEVDATEEGPACPQPSANPDYHIDEDCLTINVYTPRSNSSEPLPVIVYIHAGGFYSSSGRSDVAGPHYLLDRDLVLVTINYRLGSLGFLALGTKEAPGNNGFKDQVTALRWVQRNIRSFGGDPGAVTVAGCSAGGVSVMVHMLSPMSKGLFHRAISMSGSPTSKVASPTHRLDLAAKQAKTSDCPDPNINTTAFYECLKTKPWKDIAGTLLRGFFEFGYDPLSLWRPVVEPDFGQERFLVEEPMESIRRGRMHEMPYIISQTTDEFFWKAFTVLKNQTLLDTMNAEWSRVAPIAFILPRNETGYRMARLKQAYFGDRDAIANTSGDADALGKMYGDSITAFPVHRMANLMCRHSRLPVYYYQFAYSGNHSYYQDPITNKPEGVAHHDDLIYLFSLSARFPNIDVANSTDSKMVDIMTGIWYRFAAFGNPNSRVAGGQEPALSALHWPPMEPRRRQYLRMDPHLTVHEKLFEARFRIWDELYPIQY